jgi:hypothetical protein
LRRKGRGWFSAPSERVELEEQNAWNLKLVDALSRPSHLAEGLLLFSLPLLLVLIVVALPKGNPRCHDDPLVLRRDGGNVVILQLLRSAPILRRVKRVSEGFALLVRILGEERW